MAHSNAAFIDAQNLHLGMQTMGWKLDLLKFRRYLKEKYHVHTAYFFIGFVDANKGLYTFLQSAGYTLVFRKISIGQGKTVKGNVDVHLTVTVFSQWHTYSQAVLVTSDGDFYPLVEYLKSQDKLKAVLSPHRLSCSKLLISAAKEKIAFLDRLVGKLEKKETSD